MRAAITRDRRRAIQLAYNMEHGITAATIVKGVSDIAEFLQGESKLPKGPQTPQEQASEGEEMPSTSSSGWSSSSRRRCSPRPRICASRRGPAA